MATLVTEGVTISLGDRSLNLNALGDIEHIIEGIRQGYRNAWSEKSHYATLIRVQKGKVASDLMDAYKANYDLWSNEAERLNNLAISIEAMVRYYYATR